MFVWVSTSVQPVPSLDPCSFQLLGSRPCSSLPEVMVYAPMTMGFVNKLGYKRILPLLDSTHTYNDIPIDIAEKAGKTVNKTYSIHLPSIEERVAKLKYNDDSFSHIKVLHPSSDFMKKMTILCPTKCYSIEKERVILQHEGCIECGTCAKETAWMHPKGEKGIIYQYG